MHLTPKGKKLAEQTMAAAQATTKEWLDEAFTEQKFGQLRHLLSKAAHVFEKKDTTEHSD